MSWQPNHNAYEAFWQQSSGFHSTAETSKPNGKADHKEVRTPPNDAISDGQMSVALDKDLIDLIDNITQELSRTSTTTTARTTTSVSSGSSYLNLDFDSFPNVTDQRFNSYGSMTMQPGGISRERSTMLSAGRGSSSFLGEVPVIEEGANEDSSPIGYGQRQKQPNTTVGVAVAPKPPVYRGPRSPSTVLPTSPSSVPSTTIEDPLPQVLHALDDEDDDRIVVVRRITKLGFKSNRTIKAKFNQFGWEVKNVVLLPSRSRSMYADGGDHSSPRSNTGGSGVTVVSHARPSSMGFVVFKARQAAVECIKRGTINIEGVDVLVQPFVRQYKPSSPASNGGAP